MPAPPYLVVPRADPENERHIWREARVFVLRNENPSPGPCLRSGMLRDPQIPRICPYGIPFRAHMLRERGGEIEDWCIWWSIHGTKEE